VYRILKLDTNEEIQEDEKFLKLKDLIKSSNIAELLDDEELSEIGKQVIAEYNQA